MGSFVARNDTFIGGIDFVWSRIGGSGTLRNPDRRSTAGRRDLTLNEAFVTAFGGVRVPLGVPNLELYGTIGARNFYSGTKLTVTGPFGLFSGLNPSTRTGSCRSPASPRSIASTTNGS